MEYTAFIPSTDSDAKDYMIALANSCNVTNASVALATYKGFETVAQYEEEYINSPANFYACVDFTDESNADSDFTILFNETLSDGRYLPNVDEGTLLPLDPPLAYFPAVTKSSSILAFGDNRLVDLASRLQRITSGESPTDILLPRPFPFEKPGCEGAGCVLKYTWPTLATTVFFVSVQSFFTKLGQEKERGIKETLYLAGTSQMAYWGSWIVTKLLDLIVPGE